MSACVCDWRVYEWASECASVCVDLFAIHEYVTHTLKTQTTQFEIPFILLDNRNTKQYIFLVGSKYSYWSVFGRGTCLHYYLVR